jgi:transposase
VRRNIRVAGAKLFFCRKYNPDLNPIQQLFANLKMLLREGGKRIVEATGDGPATCSTASRRRNAPLLQNRG